MPRSRAMSSGALALAFVLSAPVAQAGTIRASVIPSGSSCTAFGDNSCTASPALSDPNLSPVFANNQNAGPGGLSVANQSFVDPRIGTANSTSGSAVASLGFLKASSAASVTSSPPSRRARIRRT